MIRTILSVLLLLAVVLCSSCVSHKKVVLFQDYEKYQYSSTDTSSVQLPDINSILIRPYDVLTISVNSSTRALGDLTGEETGSGYSSPFTVDSKGEVKLPIIGAITLEGLTILDAENKLKEALKEYLVDPFVDVKYHVFKVNVVGELLAPGIIAIPSEEANLLDAIGLAGGIKEGGDVSSVKIIRQQDSGKEVVFVVDLTKLDALKSPGFELMPHDIIYVEPLRRKIFANNVSALTPLVSFLNVAVAMTALIITLSRNK